MDDGKDFVSHVLLYVHAVPNPIMFFLASYTDKPPQWCEDPCTCNMSFREIFQADEVTCGNPSLCIISGTQNVWVADVCSWTHLINGKYLTYKIISFRRNQDASCCFNMDGRNDTKEHQIIPNICENVAHHAISRFAVAENFLVRDLACRHGAQESREGEGRQSREGGESGEDQRWQEGRAPSFQ